ncbi:PREDICTED: uridine 5'-monophosphate synthase isoform X1 [Polistes canadensis]|uniref:uridine 5'-monophosphate synthase isoform X1 n=1 Tax=Polistes canadensis TaxID=91411 RepID=UPI000718C9FF|nr:PREDICTED: uridine 5'-monophosphate synthase isoform X1 [Polistes canadensis]XP_014605360.1 PREDICTED: uridine 5'-monophosphate synthase isoform X1 [Polistes canadensis]
MQDQLKELAIALYDIGAVKFGEFITKVGLKTPVYFDLRVMIAYPQIMSKLSKALWQLSKTQIDTIQLCGVPYTALPLATLISTEYNIPMLIKRKEAKNYGTKKLIEGNFKSGDHCIIIEDVITSGSSVLETVHALKEEGLIVTEVLVVIDREQGGRKNLEDKEIKVRSLYDVTLLMNYLLDHGKVTQEIVKDVASYLKSCQTSVASLPEHLVNKRLETPFSIRANQTKNAVALKLFQLMEAKQSTLCLAADLTKTNSILELVELAGPHIVVLKIHVDIIEDFSSNFLKRLKELAKQHEFLIMEDRKFADIGNTVLLQYKNGIYKIAEWADIITVHPVAGPTIIDGLQSALNGITEPRGIFLVAEMSAKNALTTGDYVQKALSISKESDMVIGLVCQSNIISDLGMLQLTPGVKLYNNCDNLGQQYNTPESVVNSGADIAVVGRGIIEATDQLAAVLEYKQQLWIAYKKRLLR